jgi:hypothetical protein
VPKAEILLDGASWIIYVSGHAADTAVRAVKCCSRKQSCGDDAFARSTAAGTPLSAQQSFQSSP